MLTYSLLKMDLDAVDQKDAQWNVTSFRRELFLWEGQCSCHLYDMIQLEHMISVHCLW